MQSSAFCLRCSTRPALATPGGLCRECAGPLDSDAPTLRGFRAGAAAPRSDDPAVLPATNALQVVPGAPRPLPQAPAGYELVERLGGGGMGEVYLARETAADRLVAMKFVRHPGDPGAFDRFLVELRVLARLDHPHIVRVLSSDFLRADPFFTMEHLTGGSLARATADGPLGVGEAVRLVRLVAGAVAAAHAERVVHRDIKPANILLAADGTPKVADFGLAKRLDEVDPTTLASGGLGTPGYMPPEQISRKYGEIGPWSDVYGLGATLYHLLTGRAPYVGDSSPEIVAQVLTEQPPRVRALRREVPAALEGIVSKCLEKEPKDRYPSAAELVADLDRFVAGRQPEAPTLTPWRRARRWAARNRRAFAITTLVLVVSVLELGAVRREKELPNPLADIQKEMEAGQTVELLGPDGKPRYHRWAVGEGALIASDTKDGTSAVQSNGLAFLELLPDPGYDRYRVRAELMNLHSGMPLAHVGLYVGFQAGWSAGSPLSAANVAWFSELYSYGDRVFKTEKSHGVHFEVRALVHPAGDGPSTAITDGRLWKGFEPKEVGPRPWRVVVLDVTPDGVELLWGTKADAKADAALVSVGRVTAAELAKTRRSHNREAPNFTGDPNAGLPDWRPRGALGIWVENGTVAVRSVTVQQLVPPVLPPQ